MIGTAYISRSIAVIYLEHGSASTIISTAASHPPGEAENQTIRPQSSHTLALWVKRQILYQNVDFSQLNCRQEIAILLRFWE